MTPDPGLAPGAPADGFNLHRALAIVGLYGAALFVAGILAGMLLGGVMGWNLARGVKDPTLPAFLAPTFLALEVAVCWVGGGASLAAAVHWGRDRFRAGGPEGFGFVRPAPWTLASGVAAAAVVAAAYVFGAPRLVPEPHEGTFSFFATIASGPAPVRVLFLALGALVAPPLEEFVFRGVLLAGLRTRIRVRSAATITTVVFFALHVPETISYWPAMVAVAAMSILFVVLRIWSGSLYPGMVAHFVYNSAVIATIFAR